MRFKYHDTFSIVLLDIYPFYIFSSRNLSVNFKLYKDLCLQKKANITHCTGIKKK